MHTVSHLETIVTAAFLLPSTQRFAPALCVAKVLVAAHVEHGDDAGVHFNVVKGNGRAGLCGLPVVLAAVHRVFPAIVGYGTHGGQTISGEDIGGPAESRALGMRVLVKQPVLADTKRREGEGVPVVLEQRTTHTRVGKPLLSLSLTRARS